MTIPTVSATHPLTKRIRLVGAAGFWAGLAGAASALVLIVYPAQVSPEVFTYPFRGAGFTIAQLFFGTQHLFLAALIAALLFTPAIGHSRLARMGLWIGAVFMALFAAQEFFAISGADTVTGDPLNTLIVVLYGILSIGLGAALLVGGVGVLKGGQWHGATRFLPLILGVYVFVPILPALMGPNFVGRIAIGTWMLLFAVLGWILWRGNPSESRGPGAMDSPRVALS